MYVVGNETPQFVFDLLTDDRKQWVESVPWSDVEVYLKASSTITVPDGCLEDWHKAFCIPAALWNEQIYDDAFKLKLMMIRMLMAPPSSVCTGCSGHQYSDPRRSRQHRQQQGPVYH